MKDGSHHEVRESFALWLSLAFSVMWMAIGIAGAIYVVRSGYFRLGVLGALVLLAFIFLKGAHVFVLSITSLLRK